MTEQEIREGENESTCFKYIKTVGDIKEWMETSIQEDEGILDIEYTLKLLIRAIDKIKKDKPL